MRAQKLTFSTLFILALFVPRGEVVHSGEIAGRVVGENGAGVAQAVVFVSALPATVTSQVRSRSVVMDQVKQEFVPVLLPIAVGTKVYFPNHDQIHHHVYSFSRTKNFELPLYKSEKALPVRFDQPGVVKIGCNIHDWMFAIIFVSPTPYFALTDGAGKFLLKDLSPGTYPVTAWHDASQVKAEDIIRQIRVGEQTSEVVFTLPLAKRPPRPTARRGGGY